MNEARWRGEMAGRGDDEMTGRDEAADGRGEGRDDGAR